jgi:hypothetical protein
MDETPRHANMLGLLPRFDKDLNDLFLIEDKERLPPLTMMLGSGFGGLDGATTAQLPSQLARSYRQALGTRWARINRDIRQFNRQYGYWDDFGGWNYDADWSGGLDLSRSGALPEGFADDLKALPRLGQLAGFGWGDWEQPMVAAGEMPMTARLLEKGLRKSLAVAWISTVGETMRSLPGSCSVLAADHLLARRDELKNAQKTPLTDEQKQELAAIEEAIQNVEQATARLESTGPFWSYRGWDYRPRPATVEPPTVQAYHGYNWSYDLTTYAPGLYSTAADILSEVVAQYGMPPAAGKISPEARRRIDAARAAIKPVRISYGKEGPAVLAASGDRFAATQRT